MADEGLIRAQATRRRGRRQGDAKAHPPPKRGTTSPVRITNRLTNCASYKAGWKVSVRDEEIRISGSKAV